MVFLNYIITIPNFIHGHSYSPHKNGPVETICIFLFRCVVIFGFPVFGLETDQGDVWHNLGYGVYM